MNGRVLVVDDDVEMCNLLLSGLELRGFAVEIRQTPEAALDALRDGCHDVVITDLRMGSMNGLELCQRIVANRPDVPVVVITGFGSMDSAIAAMRAGAFDYIVKPLELDALAIAIDRALQHHALREEVKHLRQEIERTEELGRMLGTSEVMRALQDTIRRVSASDSSVLITGETGTGKELVARALHELSARCDKPFVAINCAAMPEQLLESELFGHVRGAFTDARSDHVGLIVRANGGTLFLDEIADLPLRLQPKLLRAVQERVVRPLGSTKEVPFDVRLLAATNADLARAVDRNEFRADLYFRLDVIKVHVPPLRDRSSDVLMLAQHFLEQQAGRADKSVVGITSEAAKRLLDYDWPGNVRELQNCVEHAVALTDREQVTVDDLPEKLRAYRTWQEQPASDPRELLPLHEIERRYIEHVLRVTEGNKRRAAHVLRLNRATLYRKLASYASDFER